MKSQEQIRSLLLFASHNSLLCRRTLPLCRERTGSAEDQERIAAVRGGACLPSRGEKSPKDIAFAGHPRKELSRRAVNTQESQDAALNHEGLVVW
jgi:hypothetical protein